MRQKLQNSKGYAESPEFLASTGAIICLSLQVDVNYITRSLDYFYTYVTRSEKTYHFAQKNVLLL